MLHCVTCTHHANKGCLSITDEHDPGDTRLAIHEITGGSPSHHFLIVRVVQSIEVPGGDLERIMFQCIFNHVRANGKKNYDP